MFQVQPKMNFDARKDYRQTLRFFNENVMPKENAEEGGGNAEPAVPMEGGPQHAPEENKLYDCHTHLLKIYIETIRQQLTSRRD